MAAWHGRGKGWAYGVRRARGAMGSGPAVIEKPEARKRPAGWTGSPRPSMPASSPGSWLGTPLATLTIVVGAFCGSAVA